jgi:hypothetical protein
MNRTGRLTVTDSTDQTLAWADDEAALRAQYPDAQWDYMLLACDGGRYDPSPAEQQQWADSFRAEHPLDADRRDAHGETLLTRELHAWRVEVATAKSIATNTAFVQVTTTCPVPGCSSAKGADNLCDHHGRALAILRAQQIANELLPDGSTVADWITTTFLPARQKV